MKLPSAIDRLRSFDTPVIERILGLAILVGIPIIGFWSVLTGAESFFISSDNVEQSFPWYQKLSQAIHSGYLPIWDANALGGHSFVGEFQPGIFYPVNIVFVGLFGNPHGISVRMLEILVLVHFAIASVAMYMVCRRLSLSVLASSVGGLIFAYAAGPFAERASGETCIFFGDALIPVCALFALLWVEQRRTRYAILAGVTVGLQVLAGHLQPASIGGLVIVATILGALRHTPWAVVAKAIACFVAVAIIIGSPQLVLGFQYLSHAYRWVGAEAPISGTQSLAFSTYIATAYMPSQFLNLIDPWNHDVSDAGGLFFGCIPLVVILLSLSSRVSRENTLSSMRNVAAIGILTVFSILMLLGNLTPFAHVVFAIPFASAAVREIGRYAILFEMFAAIVAAAALDALYQPGKTIRSSLIEPTRLGAIMVTVAYALFVYAHAPNGLLLGALIVVIVVAAALSMFRVQRAIIAIAIAAEICVAIPSLAKDSNTPSYPPKRFAVDSLVKIAERCFPNCRIANSGDSYPANIGDVYPVQTVMGNGATMYEAYYDLLGQGGFDPHSFVQDALNVRYVLSTRAMNGFRLVASDSAGRFLYERPSAFPRVFSNEALTAHDRRKNDVDFKVESYADLEAQYVITVPKSEIVVFSEQFYPGWVVSVDGTRTTMLVAPIQNSAPILRAVSLERGKHVVRFDYPRL